MIVLSICPNPAVDKFIHLDSLQINAVNKSRHEIAYPGGKGVHVAMALHETGHRTKLVGYWGGPTGRWVRDEAQKIGISTFGPEIDGWTRTCTTFKTDGPGDDTELTEAGPEITRDQEESFFSQISDHAETADAMVVSGSWPRRSSKNSYKRLKGIADQQECPLWIDASGDRLRAAPDVHPFGVHMNMDEAKDLYGDLPSPADYAKSCLEHCTVAAVTDGANGLFLGVHQQLIHAKYTVENVISTVGSGDCLTAGVVAAWHQTEDPIETTKMGVACGAANCIREELGMLHNQDVVDIKERVKVAPLTAPPIV